MVAVHGMGGLDVYEYYIWLIASIVFVLSEARAYRADSLALVARSLDQYMGLVRLCGVFVFLLLFTFDFLFLHLFSLAFGFLCVFTAFLCFFHGFYWVFSLFFFVFNESMASIRGMNHREVGIQ